MEEMLCLPEHISSQHVTCVTNLNPGDYFQNLSSPFFSLFALSAPNIFFPVCMNVSFMKVWSS